MRAAAIAILMVLGLAVPVRAQLSPNDAGIALLSLFGMTPHLADDRMHFAFNVVFPSGTTTGTSVFAELNPVDEFVETGGWGVRPTLLMQGRLVGLNVSVQFDFGSEAAVTDSVTYRRTFGVTTRYHNGLNLAGLFSPDPPVMVTVGPMLDVTIGSANELVHADDSSRAIWGRLGDIQIAPSAGFAVIRGPVRFWGLGAMYLAGQPWSLVNASAGESDGRWATADPESADPGFACLSSSAEACSSAFHNALDDIRGEGGYLVEGGLTVNMGNADREPRLSLGVTAFYTERDFSVEETGFGVNETFIERDFRVMVSVGIAIPPGM